MTFFIVVGWVWLWLCVVGLTCLWNLCIGLHLSTLATWRVENTPTCISAYIWNVSQVGIVEFLFLVGLCISPSIWSFCPVMYTCEGKCDRCMSIFTWDHISVFLFFFFKRANNDRLMQLAHDGGRNLTLLSFIELCVWNWNVMACTSWTIEAYYEIVTTCNFLENTSYYINLNLHKRFKIYFCFLFFSFSVGV